MSTQLAKYPTIMKVLLCLFSVFMIFLPEVKSQSTTDHAQIQQVIDRFIDGINHADTIKIKQCIDQNLGLLTVFSDKKKNILAAELPEMFLQSVSRMNTQQNREEQFNCRIETDGIIASVWCNYNFYHNDKIVHCGVNAYQLYKTRKGWKIIQVTDSRKTYNCPPQLKESPNE